MSDASALRLHEWETLEPEREAALAGRSLSPAHRRLANDLAASSMLHVDEMRSGIAIRATSFVGRVEIGDLAITIVPKIRSAMLLHLFRYAFGLRSLKIVGSSDFQADRESTFQDILCSQLLAEAAELIERGLHRGYEHRREDLVSPRGRIDLAAIARRGGVTEAALPCTHHPRIEDTHLNRVLLAGLHLGARTAADVHLRTELRCLARRLEQSVSRIVLRDLDEAQRRVNRLVRSYQPSLTLIELLLAAESPSLDATEEEPLRAPGFLFDMNVFFQRLLSRFLRENLPGFEVQGERVLRGMMRYASDWNPQRRRSPAPRPDLAIMKGSRTVALLDAKYRDLWERKLPREMLYQLAVYALSQGWGGTATILYPTMSSAAREARIEIQGPFGRAGQPSWVALRPVYIPRMRDLISKGSDQAERRALAHQLAFGGSARSRVAA